MNITSQIEETKLELQIAPLIDVVFLLLIYFIMTAVMIKKEGDISFMLPSSAPSQEMLIPVEVLIEITAEGSVVVEGMNFSKDDTQLELLVKQLVGLREIAESQQSPFYVNILPNQETEHQRVIDVMDACAAAKVKNLSFSKAL